MKLPILFFLLMTFNTCFSQNKNINPKGNWFFGAEVGTNTITSNEDTRYTKLQFGISSEYYFAKNWSIVSRLKYYDVDVSYNNRKDYFNLIFILPVGYQSTSPYDALSFQGQIMSIPIDLKAEFDIIKQIRFFLTIGFAYNVELKSNYYIPNDYETLDLSNFNKNYFNLNTGMGVSYFLNKSSAIYLSSEYSRFGGAKGSKQKNLFNITLYEPENFFITVGFKYCFKKS